MHTINYNSIILYCSILYYVILLYRENQKPLLVWTCDGVMCSVTLLKSTNIFNVSSYTYLAVLCNVLYISTCIQDFLHYD